MSAKEIIEKLRLTFNELVTPVAVASPVQLLDATLMDGTAVQITELIIGGVVTIDGIPAPIGEHELSDGTYIVLGDNGVITEIKTEEVVTEAKKMQPKMQPMGEEIGNKFSAFEATTNEKFASYESKFSAYEQRFSDYEARLNKATQVIEGLLNLTQTLAETPTGIPDASVKSSSSFAEEKKAKSYDILFS
jgi:spore coat protein CotH